MIKYVHIDCMITVFLITYSLKFFRFIQFFPDMMSKISNINMQIFAMQQMEVFKLLNFVLEILKAYLTPSTTEFVFIDILRI